MSSDEATAHAVPSARALRVMAVVRWALFVAVGTVAAATWWLLVLRGDARTNAEPRFYCPMHPQITSPDPGSCPVCYMQLEPIPTAGGHAQHDEHEGHGGDDEGDAGPETEAESPAVGVPPEATATVMLTTERRQASGVSVVPVRREEVGGTLRWPAVVEPVEGARAEVRVRAQAFVERVMVRDAGTAVRRGQILAWVVSPDIARAEEELLTAARWASREPAASAALEAARRRLSLLGVGDGEMDAVLAAGAVRARIPLRAPATGTVTRLAAVLGATATPEEALYEITSFARVRVMATVLSERELAFVSSAMARARFVGARGLEDVPVELELVEPTVDAASRGARVRFTAANPEGALRAGDIGEVVLEVPRVRVLLAPRDAVLDRGHAHHVFVEVESGVFEPRTVRVGAVHGDMREVLEGLEEGERVVARGGFVLDSESRLAAALAPRPVATGTGSGAGSGWGSAP